MSTPAISVLMPVYNSAPYLRQTVQSVLGQTFADFELIMINDASTDASPDILASLTDRRIRIFHNERNLGIVGTTNKAMEFARAPLVAHIDNDDICLPTRLAKQHAFMASNPQILLVGTEMSDMEHGNITRSHIRGHFDPMVVRWMFHLSNPIGNPSTMFRRTAVSDKPYLREAFLYAQDFDLSHRILQKGDISILPEYLMIYRRHTTNSSRTHHAEMMDHAATVLKGAYFHLMNKDYDYEADLVVKYFMAWQPFASLDEARHFAGFLTKLMRIFVRIHRPTNDQKEAIVRFTGKLWWQAIKTTLRARRLAIPWHVHSAFPWANETRPSFHTLARVTVSGISPYHPRPSIPSMPVSQSLTINGVHLKSDSVPSTDPPTLYVTVDTEEEFDWSAPFDRSQTSVRSIAHQIKAQEIFNAYGLRPIYLIDYAVASQAVGYEPLRDISNRNECVIGAHLHPWINPPFEESVSDYNSYGGNLPPDLERRKLEVLTDMIEQNFGTRPMFFKAGRYGIGRHTMASLADLGFAVDFSILPLTDLRAKGGPDFQYATSDAYLVDEGLATLPMTRGQIGLLSPLPSRLHAAIRSPVGLALHLPGICARLNLANTVTLTPEGVSSNEQIKLIKTLVARGRRTFVLHYHSPSLAKLTPYVGTDDELKRFLENLRTVCSYFFDDLGGMPGNPADLVPLSMRSRVFKRSQMVHSE